MLLLKSFESIFTGSGSSLLGDLLNEALDKSKLLKSLKIFISLYFYVFFSLFVILNLTLTAFRIDRSHIWPWVTAVLLFFLERVHAALLFSLEWVDAVHESFIFFFYFIRCFLDFSVQFVKLFSFWHFVFWQVTNIYLFMFLKFTFSDCFNKNYARFPVLFFCSCWEAFKYTILGDSNIF